MLKVLQKFIKQQPVVLACVLALLFVMAFSLQQILQRGQARAMQEQASTNSALTYVLEDSVVRSLQAVSGAMQSLAMNLMQRSPQSTETLRQRLLRGLPQLRNIHIVPAAAVSECQRDNLGDMVFLPVQQGRFWGDDVQLDGLHYWPLCTPYYLGDEVAGYVIGSINLNYYQSLFQSVASGQRQVSLYLYSGEKILGEGAPQLSNKIQARVQQRAWGEIRAEDETGRAYVDSYRATSFFPLAITLRSYNEHALADWRQDANIMEAVFAALGVLILIMLIMYSVHKYKREQVLGSNHLLSMAVRSTANAIFITDPKGRIEWVNEAFTRLTGYTLKQVRGKTPSILNSGTHSKSFYMHLWRTIAQGNSWRDELINRHRDGHLISVDQTITPLLDKRGNVEYYIAVHEDITARKAAQEQALYLAQHDELTQLKNRRFFETSLEQCASTFEVGKIALMFIDLDRFKEINDTLGHDAGDVLLKRTAKTLQQTLPDNALLSRLGGDEFALYIYPAMEEAQIHMIAQSIVNALVKPFHYLDTTFSVSCSIGVTLADIAQSDASSLLRQADLAMYRAKQSGKNTYRFFDESMDETMQHRVRLQRYLSQALEQTEQLSLYYQPQIDATTQAIVGVEALLRWQRQGEWISPATFIPIAEDSGQIVALGQWIIREAVGQLREWMDQGIDVGKLSINLSAAQLSNTDVARDLIELLKHHDVPNHMIAVEFTETTLMVRSTQLLRNLALLKQFQIAISIDDFGTGYCSLSYLKELDAQFLKIDRSFTDGIGNNESDECIVDATIAMAKGLNMKVIAEGVETAAQAQYLAQHGCDAIQGYYYARPMPNNEFKAWSKEHSVRLAVAVH
ncbi:putative bifunctional diguanylate cyclase/phosphodiesterase [Marinomonas ostreistagni]|uniref:putative bifunctional diguanylate cyclase/phosphodiesterase n=1 Tax=Marinomonas ostreistagni TaxID=359209 RepID=UPI00194F379D|nr:EAL domain-containing protein [Marinomonas ostreistagni]MBM6552059.1 EAL domain-containing protein [Marinomonas ostreistagni]